MGPAGLLERPVALQPRGGLESVGQRPGFLPTAGSREAGHWPPVPGQQR